MARGQRHRLAYRTHAAEALEQSGAPRLAREQAGGDPGDDDADDEPERRPGVSGAGEAEADERHHPARPERDERLPEHRAGAGTDPHAGATREPHAHRVRPHLPGHVAREQRRGANESIASRQLSRCPIAARTCRQITIALVACNSRRPAATASHPHATGGAGPSPITVRQRTANHRAAYASNPPPARTWGAPPGRRRFEGAGVGSGMRGLTQQGPPAGTFGNRSHAPARRLHAAATPLPRSCHSVATP